MTSTHPQTDEAVCSLDPGADAVAKDANGNTVATRTIHDGPDCRNLAHQAESLDLLSITNGYAIQVSRNPGRSGLSKRTNERRNGQFPGFVYNSWKVIQTP